eukprot:3690613-Alexandrium_andersonii.AAC.1
MVHHRLVVNCLNSHKPSNAPETLSMMPSDPRHELATCSSHDCHWRRRSQAKTSAKSGSTPKAVHN